MHSSQQPQGLAREETRKDERVQGEPGPRWPGLPEDPSRSTACQSGLQLGCLLVLSKYLWQPVPWGLGEWGQGLGSPCWARSSNTPGTQGAVGSPCRVLLASGSPVHLPVGSTQGGGPSSQELPWSWDPAMDTYLPCEEWPTGNQTT